MPTTPVRFPADAELQTARAAAAQSRAPETDMHALARGLAGAFALLSLPPDQKRDLLERAVRHIVIKGGTIPSITLRGGFLAEVLGFEPGDNPSPRSTVSLQISAPDLVIQFPAPVAIPIVDGRLRKAA